MTWVADTEDNHLEEEANSNIFGSEKQEQLWERNVQAMGSYFANKFDKFGKEKPQDYLSDLVDQYHFKTLFDTEEIWYYDESRGIYLPNGEYIIKAALQSQFGRKLTIRKTNEDIAQIQRSTYVNREVFDPDILWIATNNSMINLMSGETKPFSHEIHVYN